MTYVVAPSDDAMPPMLTVAKAVSERLLWDTEPRLLGDTVGLGVDTLGMLTPGGREKLGIETLGMETLRNEVGIGSTRVMAALALWKAGRRINQRFKEGKRDVPNTEKTREIVAWGFMFDAFGGQGIGDG
jgi:hypothetical protein